MKKIRNRKKQEDQEQLAALQFSIAMTMMEKMMSNASNSGISDDGSECEFRGDVHDSDDEDKNCLCFQCGITLYVGQHFPGYCHVPHGNTTRRIPEQGNHAGRVSTVEIDSLRFSQNYPQKFRNFLNEKIWDHSFSLISPQGGKT